MSLWISKCHNSTMFQTCFLRFLNAFWHSGVQMYSLLLLSRGRSGANDSAKAGRYLCRLWIDPMNDFNCDKVRGGVSASIGSVFLTNGVIPVGVIFTRILVGRICILLILGTYFHDPVSLKFSLPSLYGLSQFLWLKPKYRR